MRALLVVNPKATTTSARTRDVLIHALASDLKLEVVVTEYRGHARDLARRCGGGRRRRTGRGPRRRRHRQRGRQRTAAQRSGPERCRGSAWCPVAAPTSSPGPSGCPTTPWRPPGRCWTRCAQAVNATVGLGLVSGTRGTEDEGVPDRWFTFCAGLGFDAGVVGRVEQQRGRGKRSTHALYVRQVVRQFVGENGTADTEPITLERPRRGTGRRTGAGDSLQHLAVDLPGQPPGLRVAPRRRSTPPLTCWPSRRLSSPAMALHATQLLRSSPERGPHGKHVTACTI